MGLFHIALARVATAHEVQAEEMGLKEQAAMARQIKDAALQVVAVEKMVKDRIETEITQLPEMDRIAEAQKKLVTLGDKLRAVIKAEEAAKDSAIKERLKFKKSELEAQLKASALLMRTGQTVLDYERAQRNKHYQQTILAEAIQVVEDALYKWETELPDVAPVTEAVTPVKIDLSGLKLNQEEVDKLSQLLYELSDLRSLDLSSNYIEKLPQKLKYLNDLEELDLSNNLIRSLDENTGALTALKKLRNLNLHGNLISQVPEALTKMTQLENLDVRGNRIEHQPIKEERQEMLQMEMDEQQIKADAGDAQLNEGNSALPANKRNLSTSEIIAEVKKKIHKQELSPELTRHIKELLADFDQTNAAYIKRHILNALVDICALKAPQSNEHQNDQELTGPDNDALSPMTHPANQTICSSASRSNTNTVAGTKEKTPQAFKSKIKLK